MTPKKTAILGLTAAALLLSAHSGSAAVVVTKDLNSTSRAFYPVSSTDLINGLPATSSTYNGQFEGGTGQSSLPALNDGSAGSSTATTTGQVLFDRDDPSWNVVYTLNTAASPLGYDITSIASFAGHGDARVDQTFSIEVMFVGGSSFVPLTGTIEYDAAPSTGSGSFSTRVTVQDDGGAPLATGVSAIRFTAFIPASNTGASTGGSVYRELDVTGTATVPEPSGALLSAVGLASLACLRRRSRC
jgi:hypothetical protein